MEILNQDLSFNITKPDGSIETLFVPYNENNVLISEQDVKNLIGKYGVDIKVNDIRIYQYGMTHKSYINRPFYTPVILERAKKIIGENVVELQNKENERLELLGDCIAKTAILQYLLIRYPNENEGFITRLKTKLENKKSFSKFAIALGLDKFVVIAKQIETTQGRTSERILEDTFEAFIGSLYSDQCGKSLDDVLVEYGTSGCNNVMGLFEILSMGESFVTCCKLIMTIMETEPDISALLYKDDNYKDQLLRYYHKIKWESPKYVLVKESGQPPKQIFTMAVLDNEGNKVTSGSANSKKAAQQKASMKALLHFGQLTVDQLDDNVDHTHEYLESTDVMTKYTKI